MDELKAEENPDRRSTDSKLEPLEVNSDSGSVASSNAALSFLQLACLCDSSENEPLPESDVPTCHSLTLESDVDNESVGSSSVAEPAIGRRAGAAQDEYALIPVGSNWKDLCFEVKITVLHGLWKNACSVVSSIPSYKKECTAWINSPHRVNEVRRRHRADHA